jgi:hypothetical protein
MATFTRIKVKKQSCGRMLGALAYVLLGHKVGFEGGRVESGVNCLPYTSYLEMMATKEKFKKTGDVCFYHFVQSFSDKEEMTPWQANEAARELAERLFPDYECVVATHCDTDNLHSHIIVNSVSFRDGKKLHLSPTSIQEMRRSTTRFVWHTDFPCWNLMMAERKSTGLPRRIPRCRARRELEISTYQSHRRSLALLTG